MISHSELKYFIEVANSLNLSRASERLGISQPSLSVAVKRLESAIGTELLIRHKKGVTLTQAGKQLLAHSKQLLQYWEEVKSQTLASHYDVQGSISLGTHPSLALHFFSGFLPEILTKHSKLEIQLKYDISRKITERIINLSIDIGIVANPIKHPDLIIQKLFEDKVTFWQAIEIKNTSQNIHSGDGIILCDPELTQTQWLLKHAHKKGIKYGRVISSSNLEVIASLTAQGCGIGILPSSVASEYAKILKPVVKMPVYHDEIYLIYRHENRDIKSVQTVTSAIKTFFKKLPKT